MDTIYNQILELTGKLNGHQIEALTHQLKKELNKRQNPFGDGEAEGFEAEIVAASGEEPNSFILTSFEEYEENKLYLICEYEPGLEQYDYSLFTPRRSGDMDGYYTEDEQIYELTGGGTDWLEQLTPAIQEFLNIQTE
ncbi:MAG TPA: hypothetical protein DCS93_16935 [Microscillaceae bacterium]|nr:hypothetical protein [Microscillaceae bacterium]